jgi:hypothetical protein
MKLNRKLVILGSAAALVAAIGAVGISAAQTPSHTPSAGSNTGAKSDFVGKLAANLNVSVDQLTAASKSAAQSTVDDLVAEGKLTQDQATKIKDKIASSSGLGLRRFVASRRASRLARVRAGIVNSAANAIGINVADLRAALKDGKSVADVAAQHNVSLDTVKAQITSDAKTKLDAAVQQNKITQARADQLLQQLTAKLDAALNKKKG